MKICILSNSHHTTDVRLYYKIARSLAKLGDVYLICGSGVRNDNANPYQQVVDTESKWLALFHLYRKAAKIKPDVVICVEPLTLFAGFALRRKFGSKVIFDVHEFFPDAFAERFVAPLSWIMKFFYLGFERWLQGRCDATIGVCDEILDQLIPDGQRKNAVAIPNYPVKNVWDYSCEMPAEISTICEMDFDLIYIGGLTEDRGIFKILKSVSVLKQEFPRLTVLILGRFFSPAVEKKFNDLINDWNLNAIIYRQNWLPAEKIGLLLKRSKVGLWVFNPQSRRMRKAIPLKVLEYFAAGLPVRLRVDSRCRRISSCSDGCSMTKSFTWSMRTARESSRALATLYSDSTPFRAAVTSCRIRSLTCSSAERIFTTSGCLSL